MSSGWSRPWSLLRKNPSRCALSCSDRIAGPRILCSLYYVPSATPLPHFPSRFPLSPSALMEGDGAGKSTPPRASNDDVESYSTIRKRFSDMKGTPILPSQQTTRQTSSRTMDWVTKDGRVASHRAMQAVTAGLVPVDRFDSSGSAGSRQDTEEPLRQTHSAAELGVPEVYLDDAAMADTKVKIKRFEEQGKMDAKSLPVGVSSASHSVRKPSPMRTVSATAASKRLESGSNNRDSNNAVKPADAARPRKSISLTAGSSLSQFHDKSASNSDGNLSVKEEPADFAEDLGLSSDVKREAEDGAPTAEVELAALRRMLVHREVQLQSERVRTKRLEQGVTAQRPSAAPRTEAQPLDPHALTISVPSWEESDRLALQAQLSIAVGAYKAEAEKARPLEEALQRFEAQEAVLEALRRRPPIAAERV